MKRIIVCLMVILTMSMASTAFAAPKKTAKAKKATTTQVASEWTSLLNSYDSYVTKYISCLKKAAKGDMSAMTEYPALLQKAQELNDKLANAQSEMTTAEMNRYLQITKKLSAALR
ncbi:MAG: hypothetical protein MJZ74_10715 [Muribaculaceae bacterium]|nr:hypothetical protein [Muribaculaceae bacterium]